MSIRKKLSNLASDYLAYNALMLNTVASLLLRLSHQKEDLSISSDIAKEPVYQNTKEDKCHQQS